MKTLGLCFIYCGMALFGYQTYGVATAFLVAGVGLFAAVHLSPRLADGVRAVFDRNDAASAST